MVMPGAPPTSRILSQPTLDFCNLKWPFHLVSLSLHEREPFDRGVAGGISRAILDFSGDFMSRRTTKCHFRAHSPRHPKAKPLCTRYLQEVFLWCFRGSLIVSRACAIVWQPICLLVWIVPGLEVCWDFSPCLTLEAELSA